MTATEHLQLEAEKFSKFVAGLIAKNPKLTTTFDEAVRLFHEYEERMDRLREELRPAYEACQRGEGTPLNMEEILGEVLEEMKAKGIH